jgi:replication-associated recombination protein RarA
MPNSYFPFHDLGYQCNPFRAVSDEEWAALAIVPAAVEAALAERHVQILGDKGHGKTTILLALAERFRRAGQGAAYEHLEIGQDRFTSDPAGLEVLLLDETQRLKRSERERLLKRARLPRLILAGHEDLAPWFKRFGLALATVQFDVCPLAHLNAVIARRLAHFTLAGSAAPIGVSADAIQYLHTAFGGDIRLMEQALYEAFEQMRPAGARREIGESELRAVSQKTEG